MITLSDSYCAIGYNSFIVDQSTQGKTCTIYTSDDNVNPIFDGATLGEGVYRVTALCNGNRIYGGTSARISYDLTNDVWEVEKLS